MREQTGLGQSAQTPPRRAGMRPIPSTGHDAGRNHDDGPSQTSDPQTRSIIAKVETLSDEWVAPAASRSSTRRYDRAVTPGTPRSIIRVTTHQGLPPHMQRASRMQPQPGHLPQQQPEVSPKKQRHHWPVYAGPCLFVMLFGWIVFSLVANWWRVFQDDWHYGRPRTFHVDADVGHGGMSHFTVENLSGQILVTEIPLHDQTHANLYSGPQLSGENAALAPATLAFEDVNADGFSDMILIVEETKHVFLGSRDGFKSEIKQEGNR